MTAYYLGNLYYDKKRYDEAISLWERSVTLNPGFSIPHRNLGVAYYNIQQNPAKAIASYEKALLVNPGDGRVLSELDPTDEVKLLTEIRDSLARD